MIIIIIISATAITCPPLTNLTNGSVSYSNVSGQNNSYDFDVKATYNCNSGFALVGNHTRNCSGDGNSTTGNFDGMAPTCKGKYSTFVCVWKGSNFAAITCSPVPDPINGTVSYSVAAADVGNYVFNVTANYSCYTGFSLVGDNKRMCTGDGSSITGTFDGVAPTCERKCLKSLCVEFDLHKFVVILQQGSTRAFSM